MVWHSLPVWTGLLRWHSGKELSHQCWRCKRCGFSPWIGRIPWRRKWQPTPVFLFGKFYGQKSLVGYSSWDPKEVQLSTQVQLSGPLAKCSNQPPSSGLFEKSPCYHNKRHVLCSLHLGNSKPCARNGNEEQIYIHYKLQDHKRYLRMERNSKTEKFEKHCKRGNITQVAQHKIAETAVRPESGEEARG